MLPSHSSHVTLVTLRSIERIYCLPQRCSRQLPRSHLATPGPPHPTPPFTMAMLLKKAGVAAPARVSGPCLLWLSCVCTLKWWLRARARWQLPRGACVPRCWGGGTGHRDIYLLLRHPALVPRGRQRPCTAAMAFVRHTISTQCTLLLLWRALISVVCLSSVPPAALFVAHRPACAPRPPSSGTALTAPSSWVSARRAAAAGSWACISG
jgi:hypothetical protein